MAEPPSRPSRNEPTSRSDARNRPWNAPPPAPRPGGGLTNRVDHAPPLPPVPSRARETESASAPPYSPLTSRPDPSSPLSGNMDRGGGGNYLREENRDVPRKRTFAGMCLQAILRGPLIQWSSRSECKGERRRCKSVKKTEDKSYLTICFGRCNAEVARFK